MDRSESETLLDEILNRRNKDDHLHSGISDPDISYIKLRALLVSLLGLSMSACSFVFQPLEVDVEDDEIVERVNSVSSARRFTKPLIRYVFGYGALSVLVTALSSLMLLISVMSKSWSTYGRYLAIPALLLLASELVSDTADTLVGTALLAQYPLRAAMNAIAATLMIAVEILVWYFIAKFYEYSLEEEAEELAGKPFNTIIAQEKKHI